MIDLEHPDITAIERTGYPMWAQPEDMACESCGETGGPLYWLTDGRNCRMKLCPTCFTDECIQILNDMPFEQIVDMFDGEEVTDDDL